MSVWVTWTGCKVFSKPGFKPSERSYGQSVSASYTIYSVQKALFYDESKCVQFLLMVWQPHHRHVSFSQWYGMKILQSLFLNNQMQAGSTQTNALPCILHSILTSSSIRQKAMSPVDQHACSRFYLPALIGTSVDTVTNFLDCGQKGSMSRSSLCHHDAWSQVWVSSTHRNSSALNMEVG